MFSSEEFDIPNFIMQEWKKRFSELYKNYYKEPKNLNNEQIKQFKKIVSFVDLQELYKWVSPILQEIDIEFTKEQNKKEKKTYFGGFFGSKIKEEELLSLEEMQTIEKIFIEAVSEMTVKNNTNKNEIKLQVHFHLIAGFFNFSKSLLSRSEAIENPSKECILIGSEAFCCKYRNLKFNMKKGENFTEIETMLKEFNTEMVTIINKNETILPITFVNDFSEMTCKSVIEDDNTDFVWKLNFRQNSPLDEINSILHFQIKTINFLYHQTFLDRVISFFSVEINSDLVNQAWDKWNIIKENTSNSIKDALTKKNILEINIEPRKLIIPINKYDFKNSKIMTLELGKIKVFNSDNTDNYEDQYKLEFSVNSLSVNSNYNLSTLMDSMI